VRQPRRELVQALGFRITHSRGHKELLLMPRIKALYCQDRLWNNIDLAERCGPDVSELRESGSLCKLGRQCLRKRHVGCHETRRDDSNFLGRYNMEVLFRCWKFFSISRGHKVFLVTHYRDAPITASRNAQAAKLCRYSTVSYL
jgi:hypothetical protein